MELLIFYHVTMQSGGLQPEQEELLLPRDWKDSLPTGAEGSGEEQSGMVARAGQYTGRNKSNFHTAWQWHVTLLLRTVLLQS